MTTTAGSPPLPAPRPGEPGGPGEPGATGTAAPADAAPAADPAATAEAAATLTPAGTAPAGTSAPRRPAQRRAAGAQRRFQALTGGLLPAGPWWPAVLALVLLGGAVLRFTAYPVLWLDEAQSVAIARLPLPQLFDALREDGSPPLYYLLLHAWIGLFGQGTGAVRSLSGVFSVLTVPVVWWLARTAGGRRRAAALVVLLVASPYALRYATETRMYALLVLLTALGGVAVRAALRRPGPWPVVAVAAVSGALVWTHYWSFFLLAVVGLLAVAGLVRRRRSCVRVIVGLVLGGLTFLPWVPSLLQQLHHTGTPWATVSPGAVVTSTLESWQGGGGAPGRLLGLAMVLLVATGLLAAGGLRRAGRAALVLQLRPRRSRLLLLALSIGTLLVAGAATWATGSAVAGRYASVALLPFLALAAIGVAALPTARARAVAVLVVAGLGLGIATPAAATPRTQGGQIAEALRAASPGDTVLFCPDQLGVSVARLAPPGLKLVGYPDLQPVDRIDWTDYAQRNDAVTPQVVAEAVMARAGGSAIWVVTSQDYRVPSDLTCRAAVEHIATVRGQPLSVVPLRSYYEQMRLQVFPAVG